MAAPHFSADLIKAKHALRQQMLAARAAWDPACGAASCSSVARYSMRTRSVTPPCALPQRANQWHRVRVRPRAGSHLLADRFVIRIHLPLGDLGQADGAPPVNQSRKGNQFDGPGAALIMPPGT
jgi:hypothetical protein